MIAGPPPSVVARFVAAGCVAAEEEAREFWAEAPDLETLEGWLARREQGEPVAWITGSMTFCGRRIRVDPGVYVPRVQSEELALRAAGMLPPGGRALDLCTGAGAVAASLAAAVPTATVIGVDIDLAAVRCARANGVVAFVGDLGSGVRGDVGFDVVTAVAPYVPTAELHLLPVDTQRYEPRHALDGGDAGLDLVRRVIEDGARLLRPGGWLLCEIGGDQDALVEPELHTRKLGAVTTWCDEDGDVRGFAAQLVRAAGAP